MVIIIGTKTISASDLRSNLSDALDAVDDEKIVIVTRRGKKERAIIDLDTLEDLLAASNSKYIQTIKEAVRARNTSAMKRSSGTCNVRLPAALQKTGR